MKNWHLILPLTFSVGCIAATVGAVGLWLIPFGSAWAWFWIGGNIAVWSALIILARETWSAAFRPPRTKAVCAWCKITLREGDEPATHGICPMCMAQHFQEDVQS